ncbi:MAG TPA: alpha/beta fold hydrolase [Polyangia bacterium]|nr:alpha/beta fold hydrolase [Polyangia bacterium]
MIDDFPVSDQPAARIVGRELLAFAASSLLYPFGLARPKAARTARQAEQRTVVLVHGYLANRSTLLPLATYLRLRGIRPVHAFDYRSTEGVERAAIALREHLKRTVRGGRIDLVCHSLGGLVARVYLQELGGARRVDRCITLATPHKGTYSAYWVASRVGRELRPDSALLKRIEQSREAAARVRFTSIVAGSDNIIVPRVFASDEDVVHVPHLGHVGMLFSPTVFRAVGERLAATL